MYAQNSHTVQVQVRAYAHTCTHINTQCNLNIMSTDTEFVKIFVLMGTQYIQKRLKYIIFKSVFYLDHYPQILPSGLKKLMWTWECLFSSEVVIMKKHKKVKNTSMFSASLALLKPLVRNHSLQKKKSAHYLLHSRNVWSSHQTISYYICYVIGWF